MNNGNRNGNGIGIVNNGNRNGNFNDTGNSINGNGRGKGNRNNRDHRNKVGVIGDDPIADRQDASRRGNGAVQPLRVRPRRPTGDASRPTRRSTATSPDKSPLDRPSFFSVFGSAQTPGQGDSATSTATRVYKQPVDLPGRRDEHGCVPSRGYAWNGRDCVVPWLQPPDVQGYLDANGCAVDAGYAWNPQLSVCTKSSATNADARFGNDNSEKNGNPEKRNECKMTTDSSNSCKPAPTASCKNQATSPPACPSVTNAPSCPDKAPTPASCSACNNAPTPAPANACNNAPTPAPANACNNAPTPTPSNSCNATPAPSTSSCDTDGQKPNPTVATSSLCPILSHKDCKFSPELVEPYNGSSTVNVCSSCAFEDKNGQSMKCYYNCDMFPSCVNPTKSQCGTPGQNWLAQSQKSRKIPK